MFKKAPSQVISHDYVEERLSAYVDGQLPEAERVQVRKHLQECLRCQASLDSLGWTVKLLQQMPAPSLPRQFTLPVAQYKPAPTPWLRWGLAAASGLAAAAFLFLVTVDILTQRASPTQFAAPAAAPPPHTLVAVAVPTSAPAALDRSAAPTVVLPSEQPSAVPTATTAVQLPAAQPTRARPAAAQPTRAQPTAKQSSPTPNATEVQTQSEAASPTEANAPMVAKSALPSATCQGCGGGIGGGPPETPETNTVTSLSLAAASGIVKDASVPVRSYPSDTGPQIGVLTRDIQVQVLKRDETGDWLQIVFPVMNNQALTGWVLAGSIALPVSVDTLPTAELPTETPTAATPTETPTAEPATQTPTLVPGMTLDVPQGAQSPGPLTAARIESPTETSPPAAMALATPAILPTTAQAPTSSIARTSPRPAPSSTSPLPLAPNSELDLDDKPAFRLAEIATLVISLAFAVSAMALSRT